MSRLQELRKRAGLTQQELAVRAGVSLGAIAQLESGRRRFPRIKTALAIARVLGVEVEEIWPPDRSSDPQGA